VRLHNPLLAELDAWRGKQSGEPSRAEALRRIAGRWLGCALNEDGTIKEDGGARGHPGPKGAVKASELAAREIDRMSDPSMPDEHRQRGKRRLISGPKEFRDVRGDRPKAKR
jgi:hypothetical protein